MHVSPVLPFLRQVEAVKICSDLQRCGQLGHEFVWPRAQKCSEFEASKRQATDHYPLVNKHSYGNMAIEIVDFPIEHGDFL